ncbi:beta-fructofuranosidase, insoluble isoenzyme 1-like [Macadamia integrifolia]|uniref:beta-fructofuranosidase, insoluble isoenzyme 1-like n=1 Tax=Macadamia integrifolia TaxID=60698 RepID=UPI001C50227D|nr:beta-fructofuranosidase, insoluble isoenzyme 1-like [Macadamia integrifolia]
MEINLRYFWVVILLWFVLRSDNGDHMCVEASHKVYPELQSIQAEIVSPLYRTAYHFQPPKNWINDPNGPMYYNGIYHLFYQYNPYGSAWGNIVWAHSISFDMINWIQLNPAIYPSKPFDVNGCWSGSATILPGNKPVILYTGIDGQKRQVQNIALPNNLSDPYLREWTKPDFNPLIVPTIDQNVTAFRDPTTAWLGQDGYWRVLVGNKRKHRGMAALYKSRDFKHWWKVQHPLHSSADTGMWECPDFYPVALQGEFGLETSVNDVGIKHVLKVSLDNTRYEYYTVGKYFADKDQYVPDNTSADNAMGLRYDYGNFYASKTFFDAGKNRRILWGWANESDTPDDSTAKGWAGIQTIPRKVWLDESGKQLLQWPINEIETLRGKSVQLGTVHLAKGGLVEVKPITAAQADVEVTFHINNLDKAEPFDPTWVDPQQLCGQKGATVQGGFGPFGLLTLASKNLEEYTSVFFRVYKAKDKHMVLMCSDQSSSSLRPEVYKPSFGGFVDVDLTKGMISLRSLIDHSVVESFGAGGKTCITSRVYPSLATNEDAHLFAFNNGTEAVEILKLRAWNMHRPRMN